MNVNELKIVVSKEVSEFIEFNMDISQPKSSQRTLDSIIKQMVNGDYKFLPEALKEISYKDFILAWEFGYTVELSPEEQILALYNLYLNDKNSGDYDRMPGGETGVFVIKEMLSILKMEVPGVNTKF